MQVIPRLFKLWPWVDLDLFYAKVKFWEKWKLLYYWNYCSFKSQHCLKHSTKRGYEVEWVSEVKVILWPWSKVTQTSKLKLVFRRNRLAIWNQSLFESLRENRNENYTNVLGHMTNMAAMPIYGKNFKISSSQEPIDRWPWNLVCGIVYVSATKIVQIMTLGWPLPILRQSKIWSHRLLYEKKWKLLYFGNYCSLRSQSWLKHSTKWVNELSEYQRSRSFFDHGQRSLSFHSKNLFFSETVGWFGTKVHVKAYGRMEKVNFLAHLSRRLRGSL